MVTFRNFSFDRDGSLVLTYHRQRLEIRICHYVTHSTLQSIPSKDQRNSTNINMSQQMVPHTTAIFEVDESLPGNMDINSFKNV